MIRSNMRKIGLTGGIGAGKSAVSQYLRERGITVLDADQASRAVIEPGTVGYARVTRQFTGIVSADGTIDRKALAAQVFADEQNRRRLERIVHPLVLDWFRSAVDCARDHVPLIVFDVPLLIKSGWYRAMDAIWLVVADDHVRLSRIVARDDCTKELARMRMNSQMSQKETLGYATHVVYNNGSLEQLYAQIDVLLEHEKGTK